MTTQIQTNIPSLFAQRKLGESSGSLETTLRRLSSGVRINSAKDDAARLSITDRMTGQVRGNSQAKRNVNDGISLLQVADGALSSITESLQRMRELSVQAANATQSSSDRQAIQQEINQLITHINKIADQTEFNNSRVFDQAVAGVGGGDSARRSVVDGLKMSWLEESEKRIKAYYGIVADGSLTMDVNIYEGTVGGASASVSTTSVNGATGRWDNIKLNIDLADFRPPNLPNGGSAPIYNDRIIAHEMVHATMARATNFAALPNWFKEGTAEFIHGGDERVAVDYNGGAGWAGMISAFNSDDVSGSAGYSAGYSAVRYLHAKIKERVVRASKTS